MWNFIDESGAFSWDNKGKSLFCGVTVSDRELPELERRFLNWKRTVIGESKRELKGQELTSNQLYSFSYKLFPWTSPNIHFTLTGGDTSVTDERYLERLRYQASELFRLSSELCARHKSVALTELYRQMSGWVRNRSTANVLWVIVLQQAIFDTLQHAIVRFADSEYEQEFENIEFLLDSSFIRRDEHLTFWREWLRCDLMKSSRTDIITIKQWGPQHPFKRKYRIYKGLSDYRDLFYHHTTFHDSKSIIGLQIADICAHIFYRYFRNDPDTRSFDALRPRIIGKNGVVMHIVGVNETSLHKDDLSNHVSEFDLNAWKQMADEREGSVESQPDSIVEEGL